MTGSTNSLVVVCEWVLYGKLLARGVYLLLAEKYLLTHIDPVPLGKRNWLYNWLSLPNYLRVWAVSTLQCASLPPIPCSLPNDLTSSPDTIPAYHKDSAISPTSIHAESIFQRL